MFRPFELFIGLRYTRAKRRNHFISFISLTSMIGIAVGVMALIVVISVMNGFEKELRERILGMASHATVSGPLERLSDWRAVEKRIEGAPHVLALAPYVQAEAMLSAQPNVSGAIVRGVLPDAEDRVTDIVASMKAGRLDALQAGGYGIVLGQELADSLGVGLGDAVMLITSNISVTPVGALLRERRFTVVGIFQVGMYEYDRGTAFVHLTDAQKLFRLGEDVSGLRLQLDDMFAAPRIARDLAAQLGPEFWVSDWTRRHANFFRAVKTERTVMFVILALIVAVAAFNIVSTLVMVVQDKQADIAILRTLGATPGAVMRVFMVQGTLIGVVGTLIGVVLGVLLALNVETLVPALEELLGRKFLPPDVYYISELPSQMKWSDVARIAGLSFVLSVLATLYPAWRASRTQPAEALRYE
ncbi:MAG: lipoprotein-releasing ABC transporter permease subunit [Halothiobacillaceae bacterium]|jgi:lipoprotein-releasing system permease protein|nr:lipoprotein-releasing ABC transporter permease subunit [Halothiobacillaceae bacterium]MDY0050291.1 lipoprotein-releasing ABC transporter permease subunit [Halothiobacillaceae bacterium]